MVVEQKNIAGTEVNGTKSAVLCYHSLDDSGSVISVTPEAFRSQMRCLAESGRAVVPLTAVHATPGSIAITFDDGFRNFFEIAYPILQQHGFPATVFVVTGHCGGRNDWPTQPAGMPVIQIMDWRQIQEAARHGITMGAHTVTHPRLASLLAEDVRREILESRDEIQNRVGMPVETFAYPYGDHNAFVRETAQQHFRIACGTTLDFVGPHPDLADLARLDAYYLRSPRVFEKLVNGKAAGYIFARRSLREIRRWVVH